jgi:acetylornithine deacetylase
MTDWVENFPSSMPFLHFLHRVLAFASIAWSISALNPNPPSQYPLSPNGLEPLSKDLSDVIAASPLLTLHRALCEIESISNNENAVGKLLASYLEAHNFTVTTQEVPQPASSTSKKPRYNIFATPQTSSEDHDLQRSGPKVVLTSHIDTVPPFLPYKLTTRAKASLPEFPTGLINRSEVFISGRGTVDAKACVATQIHAALSLLHSNSGVSPADLALLFVVGEETTGDGMLHFSDSSLHHAIAEHYQTVIFGEPTELKLASGHKGVMRVDLTARGKAAHSGYPWLGRSANSMLVPALMVLDRLGDLAPEEGGLGRSDKYGNSTVNIGLVRGGVAANVVAEHAEASVMMRLAGGTIEEAKRAVSRAVAGMGLEVDFSQGYGPVGLDADVEGFGVITVNYGTDVPNLGVRKGVKRYLYGPGSILVAHSDHEGLTVGDLEEAVEGYKKLVLHALGK